MTNLKSQPTSATIATIKTIPIDFCEAKCDLAVVPFLNFRHLETRNYNNSGMRYI